MSVGSLDACGDVIKVNVLPSSTSNPFLRGRSIEPFIYPPAQSCSTLLSDTYVYRLWSIRVRLRRHHGESCRLWARQAVTLDGRARHRRCALAATSYRQAERSLAFGVRSESVCMCTHPVSPQPRSDLVQICVSNLEEESGADRLFTLFVRHDQCPRQNALSSPANAHHVCQTYFLFQSSRRLSSTALRRVTHPPQGPPTCASRDASILPRLHRRQRPRVRAALVDRHHLCTQARGETGLVPDDWGCVWCCAAWVDGEHAVAAEEERDEGEEAELAGGGRERASSRGPGGRGEVVGGRGEG